jgi:hypothetical protein
VEDVEAEGGAVGEHGEGTQPTCVVDGALDAVAILVSTGSHAGVLPGVLELRGPGHARSGPHALVVDAYQRVAERRWSLRPR